MNILRVKKLQKLLKNKKCQAMLVSHPANVTYLSGFTSSECWLFITRSRAFFLGDFRYFTQAKKEVDRSLEVMMIKGSVYCLIQELCSKHNINSVFFEPGHLTFKQYSLLKKILPAKIKLFPASDPIEQLRMIKSPDEIKLIKKAVQIVKKSLSQLKPLIKPGIREIEVKNKLEIILKANGSESPAFDPIVASGPNAAMPHAVTSNRKIKKNEPVIVDVGASYKGYKSDLTRTFFSGKISQYIEYYKLVATAQDRAIKLVRPQVIIRNIDKQARTVLKQADLEQFFGHALGHGVGLEVHEAPYISSNSQQRLKAAMIFTVEPGIYIPDSGGIRIEDMILVTNKGCEIL
jgi:Xaa-Pro aminopeptidase